MYPMEENKYGLKEKMQNALMGSFPLVVLFVVVPLAVFKANRGDLDADVSILMPFFQVAALGAVLLFLAAHIRRLGQSKFFQVLFLLGIFLLIRDAAVPLQTEGLMGLDDRIEVFEPMGAIVTEIVLFILTVVGMFLLPGRVTRRVLFPAAMIFVAINITFALPGILGGKAHPGTGTAPGVKTPAPAAGQGAAGGNVYLICFDSFVGHGLEAVLGASGMHPEDLRGFTYFKNNRTNYTFTWPSLASALGGGFYGGGSAGAWIEEGRVRGGAIAAFAREGYNPWNYGPIRHEAVPEEQFIPRDREIRFKLKEVNPLEAIWYLRLTPTMFRREVAEGAVNMKQIHIASADITARSVHQLKRFVMDEEARPAAGQLVFCHFYIPHVPFVYDCQCREDVVAADYVTQSACCMKHIRRWLEVLKAQGKYESSTIIIFGDHGTKGKGTGKLGAALDKAQVARLRERGLEQPMTLELWSSALMLIKPPGTGTEPAPLEISGRLTQNGDMAATLTDMTGVGIKQDTGISVFAPDFPPDRAVDVFDGFGRELYVKWKRGLPAEKIKGQLTRYRYSLKAGWQWVEKIDCRW